MAGAGLRRTVRQGQSAPERGDQVAAVLARPLAHHSLLCDLVGAQPGALEHNVSVGVIIRCMRSSIANRETMTELVRHQIPEFSDSAKRCP